jgi:hypothetical protein
MVTSQPVYNAHRAIPTDLIDCPDDPQPKSTITCLGGDYCEARCS